jgi:hypothetical protein
MVGIGMIAVVLGIIGLIYGIMMRMKAGRVTDAPLASTGDVARRGREVAGPKGQISAQGNVICQQPIIAPFSGQPCLFYKIKCTARWKQGESHKSKVIDETKMAAQFAIDDGSGPIWVDAREGGDFEPSQKKSETKGTGILGGVTGTELVFGQYRVNTPMLDIGTKYEVEEEIMPVVPRVYACGKLADDGGSIASPSWRQLILSSKSREELLSSATKTAKIALIAGGAAFVVGSGLASVGQYLAGKEKAAAAATAAMASASADPAAKSSPSASVAATASAPADSASAGTTKTTGAVTTKVGATKATTSAATAKASASAKPAASAAKH